MIVYPFETAVYCIDITNTGTLSDSYILDCPDLIDCCYWSSLSTYNLNLNPNETDIVILIVTPYWEQENTYTITVRATSTKNPTVNDSILTFTTVILNNRTIDVSTDKPVYQSGENITLTIKNICQAIIEGNPEFEIFNENGELVYGCYPDCWITLEPGETFECLWEPHITQGKYLVQGRFITYNEIYNDEAVFFIFDSNQINVTTDKTRYNYSEIVKLMITNIADNNIDGNPQFDIFDKQGNIIFSLRIYLWINLTIGETWYWEWDQKDKLGQQVIDGKYLLEGRLNNNNETYIDNTFFYIGENNPPDAPIINGSSNGRIWEIYDYNFSIFDPDGDSMYIHIDWEHGTPSKWDGPFPSGSIIKYNYTWRKKGIYTIRAQTQDIEGLLSDWGTLKVTIPRTRALYNFNLIDLSERVLILEKLMR